MVSKIFSKLDELSSVYSALTDEDLLKKSNDLKEKGSNIKKYLPQALALVKEATQRALKTTQFNNQVLASLELFKGNVVEMKPGEGKSFAIILASYLKVLSGKKLHIMSENDFLLQRDFDMARRVFKYLGITVGAIPSKKAFEYEDIDKAEMYAKDIVYVHNIEAGFDFLKAEDKSLFKNTHLIVDDIDRILATQEPKYVILVSPDKDDMDRMLLVDFVKEYESFSGIADFALRECKFYKKYLNKKVVVIEDNLPNKRIDLSDNISKTKEEKFDKIISEIFDIHKYRCPVILVVPNEDELSDFTKRLDKKGFSYNLVKGVNENNEAYWMSQSAKLNALTVVSRVSGVDNPVGGDSYYFARSILNSKGFKPDSEKWNNEWEKTYNMAKIVSESERKEVENLGGVFVIISEHTDKDDYFRYFAARRGEPGSVKFFISLQDSFLKCIDMKRFFAVINSLNLSEEKILNNTLISSFIVKCASYINRKNNSLVK